MLITAPGLEIVNPASLCVCYYLPAVAGTAAHHFEAAGAMMYRLRATIFATGLILSGHSPALANDSAAEPSIGGLQFTRSPNVEMRSEDLRISLDRVSVRYEFVNISAAPVTLTVAF